ncbi:MAG: response regulator [Syntrophobacterales bacterium]|nr:MAG: response regulator [Syntrophobacterales bacterium]
MAREIKKVLIVDDEETLTWSMAKSLSRDRDKYEVEIANNGKEALDVLGKMPIDLVISDIRMPDINGLDLLIQIKKDYPQTKVIIMTAYGSSDVQKEASKRGSLYYIEKPFEINEIRKLILDLVREKRGFEGKLFDLQLTDIIQMNCLGRVTTSMIITKDNHRGVIYFNDGEIVHAECDDIVGEEAFYIILGWQEGKFVSNIGVLPSRETISSPWEHLLMEGMKRKDETGAASDKIKKEEKSSGPETPEGQVDSAFSQLEEAEKEARENPDLSHRMCKLITKMEECEGVVAVSRNGKVEAFESMAEIEEEGVLIAFLGLFGERMGNFFRMGKLNRILYGNVPQGKMIFKHGLNYYEIALKKEAHFNRFLASLKRTLDNIVQGKPKG